MQLPYLMASYGEKMVELTEMASLISNRINRYTEFFYKDSSLDIFYIAFKGVIRDHFSCSIKIKDSL